MSFISPSSALSPSFPAFPDLIWIKTSRQKAGLSYSYKGTRDQAFRLDIWLGPSFWIVLAITQSKTTPRASSLSNEFVAD
jgi:hypothetical protein